MNATIFTGNIIHCKKPFTVSALEPGFVAVRRGKILAVDNVSELEKYKIELGFDESEVIHLSDTQILIPGLIDTHIHAAQYPNIGLGYDRPLLEWLDKYTFPLEQKFQNKLYSSKVYDAVVKKTLTHGTTTACYFASMYVKTTLVLADTAIEHGQRALVGKVNMTRSAPSDYLETPEETITNTRKFINSMLAKRSNLVKPVITPRFAPSLTMDEMKKLAELAKEFNLRIQTHISENPDECKEVERLFGKPYAEVYNEANLLTEKTILAHAVYLSESEKKLIAESGTSVSHCPSSNMNLRSGLCDVKSLLRAGINVGLGTDVAGGRSLSIIDAMRSALDTSVAISFDKKKQGQQYDPLNCYDVFYMATLGGAKALAMDDIVGNFEAGKEFDALLVDMDIGAGSIDYPQKRGALELLQKFVYLGDDRNVLSVFIAGEEIEKQ